MYFRLIKAVGHKSVFLLTVMCINQDINMDAVITVKF